MNRLISNTEAYRIAGIKVGVDDLAGEYRVRLVSVDDPTEIIESDRLTPDENGEIDFSIDTGQLEERTYRATLVRTANEKAEAILELTRNAMSGQGPVPLVTAEDAQEAGFPLETPLGMIRTRDPLEQLFSAAPAKVLEHIRAFCNTKQWSDTEHDDFVQKLRDLGIEAWRAAVSRDLSERQTMLAMLDSIAVITASKQQIGTVESPIGQPSS